MCGRSALTPMDEVFRAFLSQRLVVRLLGFEGLGFRRLIPGKGAVLGSAWLLLPDS